MLYLFAVKTFEGADNCMLMHDLSLLEIQSKIYIIDVDGPFKYSLPFGGITELANFNTHISFIKFLKRRLGMLL